MSKKGKYKIPFDIRGNLLDYVGYDNTYWEGAKSIKAVMEDNFIFRDILEYTGYSQGRSSAHMHFTSVTSHRKYHMTLKDFHEVLVKKLLINNKVEWDFTFAKRGSNFMLIPIFPKP